MSNAVLSPGGISGRYMNHKSQLMTLRVTRQAQDFVTSGDQQLCDVTLLDASVELVGEPGIGNFGDTLTSAYKATVNQLHAVNNEGVTSTVYGVTGENRILASF